MQDAKHRPRKRFGQHFLRDLQALEEIASLINARPTDRLMEIGPGRGALTDLLIGDCPDMCAIEIDRDLCRQLRARFPSLQLIEADVLTPAFEEALESATGWRLVGNLPYNISTPLLARVAANAMRVQDAWFLLQREVALRIAAEPGTRDWGRLSILVRLRFHAEIALTLDPDCFFPPPKGDFMSRTSQGKSARVAYHFTIRVRRRFVASLLAKAQDAFECLSQIFC